MAAARAAGEIGERGIDGDVGRRMAIRAANFESTRFGARVASAGAGAFDIDVRGKGPRRLQVSVFFVGHWQPSRGILRIIGGRTLGLQAIAASERCTKCSPHAPFG